jgi:hypothetical protein
MPPLRRKGDIRAGCPRGKEAASCRLTNLSARVATTDSLCLPRFQGAIRPAAPNVRARTCSKSTRVSGLSKAASIQMWGQAAFLQVAVAARAGVAAAVPVAARPGFIQFDQIDMRPDSPYNVFCVNLASKLSLLF